MTNLTEGDESAELARSENGDSTSSELERLQNSSPCPSGTESPTERGIAKSKKQEQHILRIIAEATKLGTNTLDLSNKGMRQFPSEILEMPQLEYLYIEGNELTAIPDELFDRLPNLKWLDLRRNYLVRLPSVYTGRHKNLRNLLLEGNNLRTLPLELGLIKSLHGLNINNNPLEFPPPSIIEKGTTEVLKFLREMIQTKTSGKLQNHIDEGSSSSDNWEDDEGDLRQYAYRRAHERTLSTTEQARQTAPGQIAPINKSAELHRPVSYTSLKQTKNEKLKKAGAMGIIPRREQKVRKSSSKPISQSGSVETIRKPHSATSVLDWKVNPYPEPPSADYVSLRAREERQMAKEREFKEKTDIILQRRKDEELLKGWRMETKRLQQKRYFESLRNGTKDFLDPVEGAPFDIDRDYIKIPTNEERIKQDVKSAHEKIRRAVSPATRQRIEEEKAQRILQLEKRIKTHTSQMHDRRKAPKGTPQEEMEAARKELEVVKMLQKDLLRRYTELKQWTSV
ncbi:hypothetical protein DPMN_166611 [Dreissena polymorpha]|uniref:Leucine-rich repeat-containing protein 27 n=1 Tax=Dreissena polymorpha TaxID=45954 RepID=A0A9D4IXR6_DREPO|nr:hypothetical protein DPMN_166611 [Dreissena polymorpha]